MRLTQNLGTGIIALQDIQPDEAAALLRMIQGACLPERRVFNRVRENLIGLLSESDGRAHGREDGG